LKELPRVHSRAGRKSAGLPGDRREEGGHQPLARFPVTGLGRPDQITLLRWGQTLGGDHQADTS
jgi:hypothetical protein